MNLLCGLFVTSTVVVVVVLLVTLPYRRGRGGIHPRSHIAPQVPAEVRFQRIPGTITVLRNYAGGRADIG